MSTHAKSLNQLAHELEKRAELRKTQDDREWQQQRETHQQLHKEFRQLADANAVGGAKTAEPTLSLDSTLGVRARAAERADLRKVESALRLDMGFACSGDFTGDK